MQSRTPDEALLSTILSIGAYISILSVIGSLFNILTIGLLQVSTIALKKMVIFRAIFDIIFSLNAFMGPIRALNAVECQIRGFLWTVGSAGSIFWTCCFAHSLYASVKKLDGTVPELYFRRYWIISCSLALAWGAFAVFINYFQIIGESRICHHNPFSADLKLYQVLIIQFPVYFGILYSIGCYASVMRKLVKYNSGIHIELLLYPLILIICNLPIVMRRLIIALTFKEGEVSPHWVAIIGIALLHSQGILNAVVYGFSKTVISKYKERCMRPKREKMDASTLLGSKLLGSQVSSGVLGLECSPQTSILRSDQL